MARDLSKSPQASKASAEKKLPQGASERRSRSTIVLRSIDRDEKKLSKTEAEGKLLPLSHLHKLPSEVHGHERVGGQGARGQGRQEEGRDSRQEERAKPRGECHHFGRVFSLFSSLRKL